MSEVKRAAITGITGQDGSYLSELLLSKGYEVHGLVRRSSSFNTARIDHLYQDPHLPGTRLFLHRGDVLDYASVDRFIADCQPHEVYHLAAQSHVKVSFDEPVYSVECCVMGCTHVLEVLRHRKMTDTRFYNAASSEMFGASPPPQDESTPFRPLSPYACAKVFTYNLTRMYREAYGLFACNGILFNHESPRRGETFVTRKITRALTRIHCGLQKKLVLGSISGMRDWGFAGDYVDGMWRILQHDAPDDFVIATGYKYSVDDFLYECERHCVCGMTKSFLEYNNPKYGRPLDVPALCGNAAKARTLLGWQPRVGFHQLVKMMMESDMRLAKEEAMVKGIDVAAVQAAISQAIKDEWNNSPIGGYEHPQEKDQNDETISTR